MTSHSSTRPPTPGPRPAAPGTDAVKPGHVYQPGDPIPVPEVIEDDPELAWKLWLETHEGQANGYADTQPMQPADEDDDTQPMGL